jgi:YfiH family protein
MPSEGAGPALAASAALATLGPEALIRPRWPAPPGVGALMTTRAGGVSRGPWASLNLGRHAGDDAQAVAENRRRFAASLLPTDVPEGGRGTSTPARPVWLRQVHGTNVLELDAQTPEHPQSAADAAWTRTPGIACVVGAADCLPVLFAARDGTAVAAAHAGWRGLAAGVLEATLRALGDGAGVPPHDLLAWLGPCIGPAHFEVGADVLLAFGHRPTEGDLEHFSYRPRPDGAPRWLADLQGLAAARLQRLGVGHIAAQRECTYEHASRFFSFRRDHPTGGSGRMAAAIWLGAAA